MTVNLNGDHSQWTLGTSFPACVSGQQTADGWRLHDTSTAVHTVRQNADVPHWSALLPGRQRVIPWSLEIEVTTVKASPGAAEVTALVYRGEGSEFADLILPGRMLKRFEVKGPPGTYAVHVSNGAETLSYVVPLTIVDGDKWTPFTCWVPLDNVRDQFWTDKRVGYSVAFVLMCGANGIGEMDNDWHSHAASAFKWAGVGQTNFNATLNNKFKIAGFRAGEGPILFQPPELVERDSLRFLEKSFMRDTAPASSVAWGLGEASIFMMMGGATQHNQNVDFLGTKRSVPAMSGFSVNGAGVEARCFTAGACTGTIFSNRTQNRFKWSATAPAGAVAGDLMGLHWMADASLPAITQNIGG